MASTSSSSIGHFGSSYFDPSIYNTVEAVQQRLREIDLGLSEGNKKEIGDFPAYTFLAACADLCNERNLGSFSPKVQVMIQEVVKPVIESSLELIGKFHSELSNKSLNIQMASLIDKVLFYPARKEFEVKANPELLDALKAKGLNVLSGVIKPYKLNPSDLAFRGVRAEVDEKVYAELTTVMAEMGFKHREDMVGSGALSRKGVVEVISPQEMAEHYDAVMKAHHEFDETASIEITGTKDGCPQAGRIKHVFMVTVALKGLEKYRESCGLNPRTAFAPGITLFSHTITPESSLEGHTVTQFAHGTNNKYLDAISSAYRTFLDARRTSGSATVAPVEKT